MKKLASVFLIIGTMAFVACGPSAKELEKKRLDSLAKADSIAAVQAEVKAAMEKAKADSIKQVEDKAKAETAKKDKKKGKKEQKKK